MSIDAPAFDCLACGTRASTEFVDYDELGYAVCPVCGRSTAPASESKKLPAGTERDAPTSPAAGVFEWVDAR